ncbi:MAG: hypothetical protein P8Q40_06670 [Candidatus Poseidonia sp.]|uniref:hypothetical protein n=1 Tax=Poseidonia sp. TaxID=2666344 RepID=UPI0030BAEDD9|nr:hypothetical protein [Poseidonia sp.]
MDSSPFKFLFEFLFGPQAAAGLVGLIGLIAYFLTDKRKKNAFEEDDLVLASSNSTMDSIYAVFFILQSAYGFLTLIFVSMLALGGNGEVLYIYTWISFEDTTTWNAQISIIALLCGGLLYSMGFLLSGIDLLNIAKIKFDARSRLLSGAFTARDEPSPSQTDEHSPSQTDDDLPLLRVLQAFLAAGLLLSGDLILRVILFAGFLKVFLRIRRFESPQVTDDDPPEANNDTDQTEPDEERTEPVTFSEILEALDAQLKEAIEEAHDLREELEETKSKVITLEEEVQGKDILIGEIEASKTALSQQIEHQDEEKVQDEKKLSLTDSVMVGDSIMGGMKIDQQINNDPDAIARAVIAAYRAGREDKE